MKITPKDLELPKVITAYCNKCKRETDHLIYKWKGDIYIKCSMCGEYIFAGHEILAFETLDCPKCRRKTLHAIYRWGRDKYVRCIGCGHELSVGD